MVTMGLLLALSFAVSLLALAFLIWAISNRQLKLDQDDAKVIFADGDIRDDRSAIRSNAEVQKCMLDFLPYPGPSPKLEKIVAPDVLKTFPTSVENKKVQWLINGQWWFDHAAEVEKRWNEFKLQQ